MHMRVAALLLLALFPFAATAAQPLGDCSGAPEDAVLELPAPLSEWGALGCTPEGHFIANHPGWVWGFVGSHGPVGFFANMDGSDTSDGLAYFTRIELIDLPLDDPAVRGALAVLMDGLGNVPWENAWRLEFVNAKDQGLSVYFFAGGENPLGGTNRWGILCDRSGTQCSRQHRFMIVDKVNNS